MQSRRIGPFQVSALSLGCMNLSHAYGAPPPPEHAERLLLRALDLGVTMFDTAALYGFGANETLIGRVLGPHRTKFTLASKGGMAGVQFDDGLKRVINGRPEAIRRNCEDSLRRLQTDHIDLYYLHRWDRRVPIEDSVGEMSRLLEAGKVRALGLSEVSAATLRRAHAVHPIAAMQSEYSLWSRNVEIGVLSACKELGVSLVAFSPLARAFLTGALRDVSGFDAKDIRRGMPRFEPAPLRGQPGAAGRLGPDRPRGRLHAGAIGPRLAAGARRTRDSDSRHDETRSPGREPRCGRRRARQRNRRAPRRADQPAHGGRRALQRGDPGRDRH